MTPVPAELLALAGESVEISAATRPGGLLMGYHAGPAGSGQTPLLLVHSVNAAGSAAEVRPLFEQMQATRAVLALDLPGFGISERSDRPYTPRLMTDALHQAIAWLQQRHGVAQVDVLAVSLACEFAARAAVEAPQNVRRLALVSPTGFRGKTLRYGPAGGSVGPGWVLTALRGPGWGAPLFRGLTRPGVIRYFLERTWGSKDIDEALWRYDLRITRQAGAHHAPLAFLSAQLFSTDINTLYESLALPVWASHGTRGDFTDYRGLHTVEKRPNWRISVYKGCGALMYFEQPAAFCAELDSFLR